MHSLSQSHLYCISRYKLWGYNLNHARHTLCHCTITITEYFYEFLCHSHKYTKLPNIHFVTVTFTQNCKIYTFSLTHFYRNARDIFFIITGTPFCQRYAFSVSYLHHVAKDKNMFKPYCQSYTLSELNLHPIAREALGYSHTYILMPKVYVLCNSHNTLSEIHFKAVTPTPVCLWYTLSGLLQLSYVTFTQTTVWQRIFCHCRHNPLHKFYSDKSNRLKNPHKGDH